MTSIVEKLKSWSRIANLQLTAGEYLAELKEVQTYLASVNLYPGHMIDGVWGPTSRRAVKDYLECKALEKHGIPTLLTDPSLDLRTVDDMGRAKLRPGKAPRYYQTSTRDPRVIVVHWTAGPTTAEGLHRLFSQTTRGVSSHWAIDATGTYQYLPSTRRGWHATWINRESIGIDICQPVVSTRIEDALRAGYSTSIVENPSSRGRQNVLSLDAEVAEATGKLIVALAKFHNIPIVFPSTDQVVFTNMGQLGAFKGIVGHHHVDHSKWDVAPWMDDIIEAVHKYKDLSF